MTTQPQPQPQPKHAPGPWTNDNLIIHDANARIVVLITEDAGDELPPWTEDDREANARLIAAAPDLLDALTLLLGFVDDLQKSNPGYLGRMFLQDYGQMNRALGQAPAAIAKATKA